MTFKGKGDLKRRNFKIKKKKLFKSIRKKENPNEIPEL